MYRLFGLQRMPRPLFEAEGANAGGSNAPASPAGDPPTLTPPPDPNAATPAPASATTPATRTRKPRAPKPPAAPPETVVTVSPKVENVVDKLENLPTPGGLVLLLVIIAIFLFAIVPVSGKRTRLRLLWDTALGRTSLPDPTQANASTSNSISHNILPGGIDNTPIGIAPTLQSTGTGSPISPAMTAASSGMSATVSGYDDNSSAYPDMFEASSYPQGYPGETEYMVPDFPEY